MATVTFALENGVGTIELQRPENLNAFSLEFAHEFRAIVERIAAASDVRVVLIVGAGRAFSAGGDVRGLVAADDREAFMRQLTIDMNAALLALSRLSLVVVTAVHGTVAGGGLGLMLAGDIVIAAEGTKFVPAYSAIAATPDCGATVLVPAAIGLQRALAFFIAGTPVSATTALEWGLVTELVPDEEVRARGAAVAAQIAAGATGALGESRLLLRAAISREYAEVLEAESLAISRNVASPTAAELLKKFAPK